jgi:hypothetical protein
MKAAVVETYAGKLWRFEYQGIERRFLSRYIFYRIEDAPERVEGVVYRSF